IPSFLNPFSLSLSVSADEVEEFVKLRVSNKYLFSGRKNTSMWAWRAILKHMGLQHKMTHSQASKKWENMKKRYKGLKNPSDGTKGLPGAWPYFHLLDDAMEGRLEGSAPILKAFPAYADFPPIFKPKKRKLSVVTSPPAPEIEVSLNGDGDDDDNETMEHGRDVMEGERRMMEREKQVMERERQVVERERQVLQREKAALDREFAAVDRDRASLDRERAIVDRERAVMERERALVEKDRDAVRRDQLALEREGAGPGGLSEPKERTEEVTENGGDEKDSVVKDRTEKFINLFEKLIENF
uniref:Si:dkeyp-38g8.5 n=1 Tax=Gasterosteus aculeatus aculeatus TaxID=481459 RepID=A0AAQ4RGL1_GASAC